MVYNEDQSQMPDFESEMREMSGSLRNCRPAIALDRL
jgi:hypothetical protein